jgi:membrane protease YdiL (CAAX protease family)
MSEILPFLLLMQASSALFVYFDSKRFHMPNRLLWIIGVALFMPFFLPFYMLLRPKRMIFLCPNCSVENSYPTKHCRNCDVEIAPNQIVPIRTEWGLMDAFMIIILSLLMGLAGIGNSLGFVDKNLVGWGSLFTFNLVGSLSLLILSLWFIIKVCKRSLLDIGLSKEHLYRNILIGVIMLIPAIFISYVIEGAVVNLLVRIVPSQTDAIHELQNQEHSMPAEIWPDGTDEIGKLISASFLMIILAPIAEEILFRGIIYNSMRQKHQMWSALLFSSLIFAFVHGQLIHFGEIFIMGLLLAYLYERTKSLVPSIVLHIAVNLLFTISLYYFPSLYT